MEARALKSSLLSEVAMKSTTAQQVLFDDVWCVTNVGCDDFFVDDLLDFSDKDFKDTFLKENEEKHSVSVDDDDNSEISRNSENFASLTPTELTVPVDEMENLEWLSQFVDDSVSGMSLLCSTGKFSGHRSEPDRKTFTVLDLPNPVHKKPRTKRFRTSGKAWSHHGLIFLTESFSTSLCSYQDSTGSYPVHAMDSFGSVQKPAAKKPRKITAGESCLSGSQTFRRCSHCLVQKTPQWRTGPLGPKTLCNACGVRFKSGRLFPEYRPACSPTFSGDVHSNSHRKVLEMRRKKETTMEKVETRFMPMEKKISKLMDESRVMTTLLAAEISADSLSIGGWKSEKRFAAKLHKVM
ncbi:GATA transcription factor [Heracleum sosnowskyi]|uniref:GATA transcription factor n=1 Tax=Heracleum sosnowskyi TaxID=360622 RepID=A0AAD8GNT9_9APIA|nr:GATA transcription factor [Heracleum sosnowskyi]